MVLHGNSGRSALLASASAPKLTERDTIVLADFDNKTGDPVFDDTLKQALTIQLEQSPFLNVLSNRKVRQTLKLMNRSPKDPMTEEVTREKSVFAAAARPCVLGSIAALGNRVCSWPEGGGLQFGRITG